MRTTALPRFDPQPISSLGRSIDPSYRSNRAAIAGSVLAALIVAVAGLGADGALGVGPIAAGGAVFLSWAIARELDPDHPASAVIALPIAFGVLAILGEPSLLLGAAVLLGARMTSGTVGARLRAVDIGVLIVLAAMLGLQDIAIVGVPTLIIGVVVAERFSRRGFMIGAAVALASGFASVGSDADLISASRGPTAWVGIAFIVSAIFAVIPAAPPRATTDIGDRSLRTASLNAARVAAGLTLLTALVAAGDPAAAAMAPAVAAFVGVAVRRIAHRRVGIQVLVHRHT